MSTLIRSMWLGLLVGCAQPVHDPSRSEGDDPGECDDGLDNDGDARRDCADAGCNLAEECSEDTGLLS